MLTQERLKTLFRYDPNTGDLFWENPACYRVKKGDKAGCVKKPGYVHTRIDGKSYLNHRLIWLMQYGYMPENMIDHINKKPGDNRLENLRLVSHQCNARNSGNFRSNSSGVKGVRRRSDDLGWYAMIKILGQDVYLGSYDTFEEVVCARLAGEQCVGWSGCDSKSPAFKYVLKNIQGRHNVRE